MRVPVGYPTPDSCTHDNAVRPVIWESCQLLKHVQVHTPKGMVPLLKAQNLVVVHTPVDCDVQSLNDDRYELVIGLLVRICIKLQGYVRWLTLGQKVFSSPQP